MLKCIQLAKENPKARTCITIALALIGLIFLISAILLIVLGATNRSIYDDFDQFLDNIFTSIPIALIAVGILILIVGGLGIIGTFKVTNTNLAYTSYLFAIAVVLEIATVITGYVLQFDVRGMLIGTMNQSIYAYPNSEPVAVAVDFMQKSLECCGIDGPSDWFGIFDYDPTGEFPSILVPESCCGEMEDTKCNGYFLSGCLTHLQSVIGRVTTIIAIGGGAVVALQILIVLSAILYLIIVLPRNTVTTTPPHWLINTKIRTLIEINYFF